MSEIQTPSVGEILKEEFMDPYGISAYKLAKDINVPVSRIQDILHDRRKITVDTSLRLGKYFDVSDRYFLDIQDDIDIRNAKIELFMEMQNIKKCDFIIEADLPKTKNRTGKKETSKAEK